MSVKEAIEIAGGVSELAARMGVRYQAVQRYRDERLPAERVIPLCVAVDWEITPHELAPAIYPYPDDAVPPTLRPHTRARRRKPA